MRRRSRRNSRSGSRGSGRGIEANWRRKFFTGKLLAIPKTTKAKAKAIKTQLKRQN